MSEKYILKLYVTGDTYRSRIAIANLSEFCQTQLKDLYEITIIDLLERPEIAEAEKILITPTLVKEFPPPKERIIGDLSNTEILSFALNIKPKLNQSRQIVE